MHRLESLNKKLRADFAKGLVDLQRVSARIEGRFFSISCTQVRSFYYATCFLSSIMRDAWMSVVNLNYKFWSLAKLPSPK